MYVTGEQTKVQIERQTRGSQSLIPIPNGDCGKWDDTTALK